MKNLAVVTMAKNEGKNLVEWINWHVLQGVDFFVIYDHLSTDDTRTVLSRFPPSLVRVVSLTTSDPYQARVKMARCTLNDSKGYAKKVAFIDVDEYLFNPDPNSTALKMLDTIFEKFPDAGGVGLNWLTFGVPCDTYEQELGLKSDSIVENCLYRADKSHHINRHIKTVFRPHTVTDHYTDPHGFHYKHGFRCVDLNGETIEGPFNERDFPTDKLRLHHYFISSIRFFVDEKLDRLALINKKKPFPEILEDQARLMRELRMVKDTSALKCKNNIRINV